LNYIDFIILALIVLGFILGFKDGLVRKIIGLAGIILGIFLAIKFSDEASIIIAPLFNNEDYLAGIAASIAIFLITIIIASIIKRLVHPHDKVNKSINQILGGLTGMLQILFFLSAVLLLLNVFKYPSEKVKAGSRFYSHVYSLVPNTVDFFIGGNNFVKEYLEKNGEEVNGKSNKTADIKTKETKETKDEASNKVKKKNK
jgi:membrane protein required for colicin V production